MRYKTDWYKRRSNQNKMFSDYLMGIINKHKDTDFKLTTDELLMLPYEDLGEIACACVNKSLSIILGNHMDYDDSSDFKCAVSQARNNVVYSHRTGKSHWQNSYFVSGTKNKLGDLRVLALNTIANKFEHFLIPQGHYDNTKSMIEIVIQSDAFYDGRDPKFDGIYDPKHTFCKWFKYRVDSFEEMCGVKLNTHIDNNINDPKTVSLHDQYLFV